ncbi:hypothetical protein CsSME_00014118 [Camellia sinensis var. sinensis]
MESLEEVLISFGIGGMTSQFAQILQSALGSLMVPPSITKIATKQCNVSRMD